MRKAITEAAENLQIYFQLGDINGFERFNEIVKEKFKELDEFPDNINLEIEEMQKEGVRVDFVNIAYRLYKKLPSPKNFKSGVLRCENLIRSVYTLNL